VVSKKSGKNVQSAKENTPNQGSSTPTEKETGSSGPMLPFSVENLPQDKIKMAEELGIPVGAILNWANSVELRLQEIQKTLPETVKQKMAEAISEARQQSMAQMGQGQGQNPQGQQVPSWVFQLLGGASGEGGMSETDRWLRDVGRDTIGLGNELYKAFIKEIVPDVLDRWEKRKQELAGKTQ